MLKGASVSVLVMAANGPSGGPWSGSLHATTRHATHIAHNILSQPAIRFIYIPPSR
jgi:hypothetical protein